jgi:hypothetical protein
MWCRNFPQKARQLCWQPSTQDLGSTDLGYRFNKRDSHYHRKNRSSSGRSIFHGRSEWPSQEPHEPFSCLGVAIGNGTGLSAFSVLHYPLRSLIKVVAISRLFRFRPKSRRFWNRLGPQQHAPHCHSQSKALHAPHIPAPNPLALNWEPLHLDDQHPFDL